MFCTGWKDQEDSKVRLIRDGIVIYPTGEGAVQNWVH